MDYQLATNYFTSACLCTRRKHILVCMVPSHPLIKKVSENRHPEEWREIWLRKAEKALQEQDYHTAQKAPILEHIQEWNKELV